MEAPGSFGQDPVYVKEQMGHSSIQVTVDCYGRLIPGGNKQAVDRLDTPLATVGLSCRIRKPGATHQGGGEGERAREYGRSSS